MDLTFAEAELLARVLDEQINVFNIVHRPNGVRDMLTAAEFLTGKASSGDISEEEQEMQVQETALDMLEKFETIRNKIKDCYGI